MSELNFSFSLGKKGEKLNKSEKKPTIMENGTPIFFF